VNYRNLAISSPSSPHSLVFLEGMVEICFFNIKSLQSGMYFTIVTLDYKMYLDNKYGEANIGRVNDEK